MVKTVQVPGETVVVEKEVEVVRPIEVAVETIKEVRRVVEGVPTRCWTMPEFGEAPQLAQLSEAGKLPRRRTPSARRSPW